MVLGRIVEVNGVNVNQENHKQVVARIKSIENETKLLGIVQKFACCNAFYVSFSCESNPNNCWHIYKHADPLIFKPSNNPFFRN